MGERLIALFLLGVVLFTPPFLGIFNIETNTAGIPTLYLYLFASWVALIVLVAVTTERFAELEESASAASDGSAEEDVAAMPPRSEV